MTVETQDVNGQPVTQSGPYAGNGVTVSFDFDFPVEKAEAVRVLVSNAAGAETVLTLTTDYTVDLGGPAGGSITLTNAALAPTGSKLVIQYDGDFNQSAAISNQGNLNLSVLEAALDKTTMHLRQLKNETDRAVKVSAFVPLDAAAVEQLTEDIRNLGTIADDITTAADNIAAIVAAPGAATAAANSATAAAASKTAAAASKTAAANSATAAADSATAAADSATAAANSATAAADSATAAANSATEAADTLSSALTKTANLSDVSSVATARNNLDVAQKQTSVTDDTAGRGLIVGAFGLGGTPGNTVMVTDDMDPPRPAGLYYATSAAINTPIAGTFFAFVELPYNNPDFRQQIGVRISGNQLYFRASANGVWSSWRKAASVDDIPSLATQAQAEAGTNNNTIMTPLRTAQAIAAIPVPGWSDPVTLATISGTAFDFTGVPAGVNEVFVGLNNVSLSGSDSLLLQIGNGAMVTSGYQSGASRVGALNTSSTDGYIWPLGSSTLSAVGTFRLTRASANNWLCEVGGFTNGAARGVSGGGIVSLTGTLDRLRLTRTATAEFVTGSVTIRWRK